MADEERGKGETADGGDVDKGSVDTFFSCGRLYPILQDFFAEDALEFLLREGLLATESATKGCRKGATAYFPEFGCGDA